MPENALNGLEIRIAHAFDTNTPDVWAGIRRAVLMNEARSLLDKLDGPPSARGRLLREICGAMTEGIHRKMERSA